MEGTLPVKRKRDDGAGPAEEEDEATQAPAEQPKEEQRGGPRRKLTKRERREQRRKHQKSAPDADAAPPPARTSASTDVRDRDQPPYVIDTTKGLRRVGVYHYEFKTHAKGRWVGRTVLDVFAKEFSAHSLAYYHEALKDGRIRLNGRLVEESAVVQEHDVLSHLIHRHEPPVTSAPIKIIHQSDELVVIDKPASIPVHPCGRYRHNTIVFLLAREYGLPDLHSVHRLDRLTSGILLLARSSSVAAKMMKQIQKFEVRKTYVARVRGRFPEGKLKVDDPLTVVSHKTGQRKVATDESDELASGGGEGEEGEAVAGKVKSATTVFERFRYDEASDTSLVWCVPETGRTHQIRVHLQSLGHPIPNDPLYAGDERDNKHEREESECPECHQRGVFADPREDEMCIWLHAYSYECVGHWAYKTDLPEWAA